jgi:polyisoprenoid-binding protein YceI
MRSWIAATLIGAALPAAAASYTVDKDHTFPSLEFPHMGISWWRGKFTRTTGKINYDAAARTGDVNIVVQSASIDFGHKAMNEHAIGPDWLNSDQFPTVSYVGKLRFDGAKPVAVDGNVNFMGTTRPMALKINSFSCIQHPFFKREVCGADAEGEINRADFGLKAGAEGALGVVRLRIQVEALKD